MANKPLAPMDDGEVFVLFIMVISIFTWTTPWPWWADLIILIGIFILGGYVSIKSHGRA